MYLLALDDLVLDDWGIAPALIDSASDRLAFDTRREDGSAGSLLVGGAPAPARWHVTLKCDDVDAHDAVLAALAGAVGKARRLLAERLDTARTRVVTTAALIRVDELNELDFGIVLESDDSVWHSEALVTTSKTFTVSRDHHVHVAAPGNTVGTSRITLTPTGARSSTSVYAGWRYRRRFTLTNLGDVPIFRFPARLNLGNTTGWVGGGKARADGEDVRVLWNGVEQARTLVGWNSASSFLWLLVPALEPGETMTVDVLYGNPNGAVPPTLVYPDKPAFSMPDSSNVLWSYPVWQTGANAGTGAWRLSRPTPPAMPDYAIPGAWRPVVALPNPDNTDVRYQRPYRVVGGNTHAVFDAGRASEGADFGADTNDYEGVAIYSPLPIESIRCNFMYLDESGHSEIALLARESASAPWGVFQRLSPSAPTTEVEITTTTYLLPTPSRHLAVVLWPENEWQYDYDGPPDQPATARWHTTLELAIDNSDLLIEADPAGEEEIYEFATELRLGGGASRRGPYAALLVGNARRALGAGTPRAVAPLGQSLVIDTGDLSHGFYSSGGALVEAASAHAIAGVVGWDDNGTTEEAATAAWLPLSPARTPVPNGDFGADIGGWLADASSTAGMTIARTHDAAIGGAQAGSLKTAITPNTAGVNAEARTYSSKLFPVNGREIVDLGAWVRTSNANLRPQLALLFYAVDADGDATLLLRDRDPAWGSAPTVNTGYMRLHATRVPPGATHYRIGLVALAASAGATGNVWFDDITLNDADVWVDEQVVSGLAVEIAVRAGWLT